MDNIVALVRRYGAASLRHRWKALALAWMVCVVGWAGVYNLPDRYQSSARVYADADAILGALLRGIAVDSVPATQVELLQRTLLSRPNLEKVLARTDLGMRVGNAAEREELLRALARQIRITPQTKNLFTLSYQDDDPRVARDVVQTLIDMFIESATGNDRQQMENARVFLAQQIASYETQLREAERRRAEFRARFVDLLPSDALGGATRLEAARGRLVQLRGELHDAQSRRDLTRQQLEAVPAVLAPGEVATGGGGGGSRLAEAERNLRELLLRYTDQHPDVITARAVVAALRSGGGGGGGARPATAARGGAPNPLHEQLKMRMVDANAQILSLERQVRDEQSEVERLDALARNAPQLQAQFTNLDRDYTVLLRQYEELLERREALQVAGAARTGADRVRMEVVDPPLVSNLPIGPNRRLLVSGVLAAGLGVGAALALLLAQFDHGFHTLQDLRQFGLPVLGVVSTARPSLRVGAAAAFAGAVALLFFAYGAAMAGGPALMAKLPSLVARVLA